MALAVARANFTNDVSFNLRSTLDGDGLTMEGYGAVFGQRTRIDSWEGFFDEEIKRGAFAKTIKDRTPVIQWDHGRDPSIGTVPIAAIERLEEDNHGLFMRARLHDNEKVKPIRDAIASRAISGMSFRFEVIHDEVDNTREVPLRTLTEVRLHEVGPVAFPAYEGTSIGVRSRAVDRLLADPELRAELERILGTPVEAAQEGTSEGAATPDQEPPAHSGLSTEARLRALALL